MSTSGAPVRWHHGALLTGTRAQRRDVILAAFDWDLKVNVRSVAVTRSLAGLAHDNAGSGMVKVRIIDGRPTAKLIHTTDGRNQMINEKENDSS
jgi:hypothetical protein